MDSPLKQREFVLNEGVDFDARVIHLDDEISEDDGPWFANVMQQFRARDRLESALSRGTDPIHLHLTTPGGDVTSMFAIHDMIRTSHVPIHIHGYGQIVSAGVLLLACGHHRVVTESAVVMTHEPTVGVEEDLGFRAAKDRRRWEDWIHSYWCELMARYTPQDSAWWKRKTERQAEYWLLGGDAIVEAGLADEVVR